MELLYKIEGTIWYEDSGEKVQRLQAHLQKRLGIPSYIFVEQNAAALS